MKCAIELMAIRAKAEEDYKMEEERKDLIALKEFVETTKRTINFCENEVNNALIHRAENRSNNISVSYLVDYTYDRLGNKLFKFVTSDVRRYKDGGFSYSPKGECYSFDTLKNYLESHCLEVSTERIIKRKYGYGECYYTNLTINVPKI